MFVSCCGSLQALLHNRVDAAFSLAKFSRKFYGKCASLQETLADQCHQEKRFCLQVFSLCHALSLEAEHLLLSSVLWGPTTSISYARECCPNSICDQFMGTNMPITKQQGKVSVGAFIICVSAARFSSPLFVHWVLGWVLGESEKDPDLWLDEFYWSPS